MGTRLFISAILALGTGFAWAETGEDGCEGSLSPPEDIVRGVGVRGGPKVLLCAAAATSSTDCRFTDVQAKLLATGRFSAVDIFNVISGTPTLGQLLDYDAVLAWTNFTPQDTNAWGDVIADYIDAGGGFVPAVFAVSSSTTNRWIGGRYDTDGYWLIQPKGGNKSGSASLGTIHDADHPTVANVDTFSGGTSSSRPQTTNLNSNATLIAEWSDGQPLIVVGMIGSVRRADLGMYPPSADCSATFWDPATDGATIMANALEWVAGVEPCNPCDTNCDGSVNGQDIAGFVNALNGNPNPCSPCNSDADGNGTVNGQDIDEFIACLTP